MDPLTQLLARLVAIPSVNPMGRALAPGESPEGGMTDFLEGYFRELGVPYERQTVSPGRQNILATYRPHHARRTIFFDAHQDTVPVEGMVIPPFEPAVRDGRLHGRGACDIKGGMAAMLAAFARLVRERPARSAAVVMACTVDEEFTHTGSSYLAEHVPPPDLAIVAEPTRLDLIVRHKGAVRWKVRTRGVACHSSTPALGRNAIYLMARVVAALEEHAAELGRTAVDPHLGPATLSVGRIIGGQSVNVVPDECTIEIDRRIIPGEDAPGCIAAARNAVASRLGTLDDVEFLPPWVRMPALQSRVEPALIERLRTAIRTATGHEPAIGGVPYGTDAGPLSQAGWPCVVFGPGDIAQAHTEDEWIELAQLHAAAEAYYGIACAMAE